MLAVVMMDDVVIVNGVIADRPSIHIPTGIQTSARRMTAISTACIIVVVVVVVVVVDAAVVQDRDGMYS